MAKYVYLFLVCLSLTLVQFSPVSGLTAPYSVTARIKKDTIIVTWKHTVKDEPIHGYYISVQEVSKDLKLGAPDFVHVKKDVRTVAIRGAKPKAVYEMKVIAYSDKGHEASAPVIVQTNRLLFLRTYNLKVSGVTKTSALFTWDHKSMNNIHDISFKLVCSGVQEFRRNGELLQERTQFEHETVSTSQPSQVYYTMELVPNTHYSCHMISVTDMIESKPGTSVEFTTSHGKPSPPPQPRVHLAASDGSLANATFTVEIYPTDDQYGPISHYKVFAVPVFKPEGEPRSAPFSPKTPITQLLSHAVTAHLVSEVDEPIPFIVGEYDAEGLPEMLTFDGHWMRRAFKTDTHYSIVVAVFTKTEERSEALYSFSALADPPVYIGPDMLQQWIKARKPAAKRFAVTVVATLFSVIGIFALAFAVVFGSRYYKGARRDAYFFSVADSESDSSEEELFRKSVKPKDKSPPTKVQDPLPAPTPGKSLAEWAVENMCYNPAFEEVVYRSPETMKEMDEMLHLIAEKHARRIHAMQGSGQSPAIEETTLHDGETPPVETTPLLKQPEEKLSLLKQPEEKLSLLKQPEEKLSLLKQPEEKFSTPPPTPQDDAHPYSSEEPLGTPVAAAASSTPDDIPQPMSDGASSTYRYTSHPVRTSLTCRIPVPTTPASGGAPSPVLTSKRRRTVSPGTKLASPKPCRKAHSLKQEGIGHLAGTPHPDDIELKTAQSYYYDAEDNKDIV